MFILCSVSVFGIVENDPNTRLYISLDNDNLSGSNPIDRTPNSVSVINNGAVTGVSGILNEAFYFDGLDDRLELPNNEFNSNVTGTVNCWINRNLSGNTDTIFSMAELSGTDFFAARVDNDDKIRWFGRQEGGSTLLDIKSTNIININDWHMISFTQDGSKARMYINGSLETTVNTSLTDPSIWFNTLTYATSVYRLGNNYYGNAQIHNLNGSLDECSIWDRDLDASELLQLYNVGAPTSEQQYPFSSIPVVSENESLEHTATAVQVGTVDITTPNYVTVVSTTTPMFINISAYGAYTFNVLSNANNQAVCRLVVEGIEVANVTRNNIAGELGSISLLSVLIDTSSGNITQSLECKKIGAGKFTVSNAFGIGHLLFDESNRSINFNYSNVVAGVSSGSYSKIGEINFTVSNLSDPDLIHTFVFEWAAEYENNFGSDEVLSVLISVNDTNCSAMPRTVVSGTIGSVGGDCLIKNVTINGNYNIEFFANGSSANYDIDFYVKDFFSHADEFVGGTGALVGASFWGSNDVKLGNLSGGNQNHALSNAVSRVSFSVKANQSTRVTFFTKVVNGTNYISNNFSRDIDTNIGVVIGQDVFANIPQDTYQTEVWGNCGGANCTIVGGSAPGYLTDIQTSIINGFNVSAFDAWDNSSVLNFSVINGAIFSTTIGSLIYFINESFVNVSVISDFNGGYFNASILDHNSTQNLSVFLNQSIISFNASELVTNSFLSDVNFTIQNRTQSIFNLKAGSYDVTVQKIGYYNLTQGISIVALQNETLTISGLYNLLLNLSVRDRVNDVNISNFTGEYFNSVYGFSDVFNASGLYAFLPMIQNLSFDVQLDPIANLSSTGNFLNLTSVDTFNFTLINRTILLYTNNSINFSIFNLSSLDLLLQNVDIVMLGNVIDYDFNTSVGILYVDDLVDDTYQITFSSVGFTNNVLFATISGSNHLDINVYMFSGVEKDFIIQDSFGNKLQNVICTFFQNINGSSITIGQLETDFSGRGGVFLDESVRYDFICAKSEFITISGEIVPTQSEYIFTMFDSGFDRFVSIYDDVIYSTVFFQSFDRSWASIDFTINSFNGELVYYGMNTTYRGTEFFVNTSGIPAGGIESFNITNVDVDIQSFVNVTYFFKLIGEDEEVWNASYLLTDLPVGNMTVVSGWLDDLDALQRTDVVRGFIGFLMIIVLMVIFGTATRETFFGVMGGLLGIALNWKYELLPRELLIISAIILVFMMIADNIGGRG